MKFEELTREDIVFAYHTSPVMGEEGDDGGFTVTVYGNGNLKFCSYRYLNQISNVEMFKLSREQVHMIYDMIQVRRKELKEISDFLDNESTLGNAQEFEFLGHAPIRVWNIRRSFLPAELLKDRTRYLRMSKVMKQQNFVLDLFKSICRYLARQGIDLSLESCEVDDTCKIRVTFQELY